MMPFGDLHLEESIMDDESMDSQDENMDSQEEDE
jgi:hypothetical protein